MFKTSRCETNTFCYRHQILWRQNQKIVGTKHAQKAKEAKRQKKRKEKKLKKFKRKNEIN